MEFNSAKPSALLVPFVKQFWAIENCIPYGAECVQRVVPNGLAELMFYLKGKPRVLRNEKEIPEGIFLSGQQKGFHDLVLSEEFSVFSIQFQPVGPIRFFGFPAYEVFNQNVPLIFLLKNKVSELEDKLFDSKSFNEKVAIAETFLIRQLNSNFKSYEFKRMLNSLSLINNNHGKISIDLLHNQACLSRKQFERNFQEFIGLSPKQFLKIIRFQNSLYRKQKYKHLKIYDLVYDCGYFDQAHMINDYKTLSGKTPKQYFDECEPVSDYFL